MSRSHEEFSPHVEAGAELSDPLRPTEVVQPTARELQGGAIRGSLWTALHVVVSLPLAFLVNILVVRTLGVVDYGRLGLLVAVMSIATTMATLGAGAALMQFGSKAYGAGRPAELQRLISGTQGYNVFVAGPAVTIAVLLLVRVEPWLLVLAVVFGVLLPAALQVAPAALAIQNRSDLAAKIAMASNVGIQAAVVTAVLLVGTPDAVWSGRVIATGLLMLLSLALLTPDVRRAVLRPRVPWALPRAFWLFALPVGLATTISTLVTDRTQVILLDWLSDPASVGLFSLAYGLQVQVFAPAQAFVGPLLPALSALAESASGRARAAFLRTTRSASVIASVITVLGLPVLAGLVPVLYGEPFAPAGDYLVVMGCTAAVVLATAPHFAFLMARLGGSRYLALNLLALAVGLVMALVLIPQLGAWGAVLSYLAAGLVRALSFTVSEVRFLQVPWRAVLRAGGAVPLAVGVTLVLWFLVGPQVPASTGVRSLALAVVGGAVFMAVLRMARIGLAEADAQAIVGAMPQALTRPAGVLLGLLVNRSQ